MHPHSNRAGYLDLDGCTVVDLLPRLDLPAPIFETATDTAYSHFIPTCAECSTTFPAPGVATVRGESAMAVCRQCHRKMGMCEFQF